MTTTLDTLMKRNQDFAAHQFAADVSLMPSLASVLRKAKALIIGCADPRVEPTRVLALDVGEAVVIRNIGGRITPGTLRMLDLLNRIAQVEEAGPEGEFHVIVLQHTDCGSKRLDGSPDMLAEYFEIGKEQVKAKSVIDPRVAVAVDVATLKANSSLPGKWLVSGLVYDVATGLLDIVVPSAPLHPTE